MSFKEIILYYTKAIKAPISAVPAVKYALGVAGVFMTLAFIRSFNIDYKISIIGVLIIFIFMVLLFVFAKLTKLTNKHIYYPSMIVLYSFTLLSVATAFLFFTSVFFNKPLNLKYLFSQKEIIETKKIINEVKNLHGRVSKANSNSENIYLDSVCVTIFPSKNCNYTDFLGNFFFEIPIKSKIYTISFEKKGYITKSISLSNTDFPIDIKLERR